MSSNSKTVLIVEDEIFVVNVYKTKLEKEGYDVLVAQDGKEGLEKIKEEKPDIVLLDLILPKLNGFDVLKQKQELKDVKNIPVIILSNLGQESDIEKGKKLGAKDYLVKSDTSLKAVVQKIQEYL